MMRGETQKAENTPLSLRTGRKLFDTLNGAVHDTPPVWIMRQAGRYLPEYRALRAQYPSFMDFCYTPSAATEATLQPIRRYDLDAAIIFSDILTVPDAMGCDVTFVKNAGPQVTAPPEGLAAFSPEKLQPVYEAISRTRAALDASKSLLGFCGLPWTLLLYITGVPGEKEFATARREAVIHAERTSEMLERLTDAVIEHAVLQAEAGADVIQLFESWAGLAPLFVRDTWITQPARNVIEGIRARAPGVKIILFARGLGEGAARYAAEAAPDGLGVDPFTALPYLRDRFKGALQGNFDPHLLFAADETIRDETAKAREAMRGKPYIANLGHGILPQTDPQKTACFINAVRGICD